MDLRRFFLDQHAFTHAAEVSGATEPTVGDSLLAGLSDEQVRRCPQAGVNSLAWLLWHMARSEDALVNVLLAGDRQVFEEEGWGPHLGLRRADWGSGMTDGEVEEVTAALDLAALQSYRVAVGKCTRAVVEQISLDDLDAPIAADAVERLLEGGAFAGEVALQLRATLTCQPRSFILMMPASGHNYLHVGEALCVRTLLERLG